MKFEPPRQAFWTRDEKGGCVDEQAEALLPEKRRDGFPVSRRKQLAASRWKLAVVAAGLALVLVYLESKHVSRRAREQEEEEWVSEAANNKSPWTPHFHHGEGSHKHPHRLKPCDWTFTIEFGAMHWGLGSTLFVHMLGIDWALLQGRTILFDRVPGIYGSYQDFFQPRERFLPCQADEDLFDVNSTRVCADQSCVNPEVRGDFYSYPPLQKNHTAMVGWKYVTWAREWGLGRFMNEDDLRSPDFPQMDSQKPLPIDLVIPATFREAYRRMRSLTETYFQPSFAVQALIAERVERMKPIQAKGPVIVVHWRAGDKVRDECVPSERMSCGNVTLHAETAWNAYIDLGRAAVEKPTLAIVTAEHDAVDLFKADPIGSRFADVMSISTPAPLKSWKQFDFNELPLEAKRADMQHFLADYWYAIEHADAFVVSGNSNMGRIALMLAGEEKLKSGRVRSVDAYWHPGIYMIAPPKCMGRKQCYA